MHKIILFIEDNTWMSEEYIDGNPNPELLTLFGTHIIPTAFTSKAKPEQVTKELKRLCPKAIIEIK